MKKTLVFFLVFLFFCFSVTSTLAQDFDYNKAYQDYVYNFNLYRSSQLTYVTAKNEYLTYKSLASETKALESTRLMLRDRAEALRTYLQALRMKLSETTGIQNYQENVEYVKLDTEMTFISKHRDSLSSVGSLEDLVDRSKDLEDQYPAIETLSYQSLGTILTGKVDTSIENINKEIVSVELIINKIKSDGANVEKLERWLLEAKKKVANAQEKEVTAKALLKVQSRDNRFENFNEAQAAFYEANQYLKESVSFLNEIIDEIKYLP